MKHFHSFYRVQICTMLFWGLALTGALSCAPVKGTCEKYCSAVCERMKSCSVGDTTETCNANCLKGVPENFSCKSDIQELEELSCENLTSLVSCATYCEKLCVKSQSCGHLSDPKGCAIQCMQHHRVCNLQSIEIRSCQQIEKETGCYKVYAEAEGKPVKIACDMGSLGGKEGDLCTATYDCFDNLACLKESNTCGPCTSHEDCNQGSGSQHYCGKDQRCHYASCLKDEDCKEYSQVCSPKTFRCVDCSNDQHCPSEKPLCRNQVCVRCATDEDCPGGKCDEYLGCVQCKKNTDCDPSQTCYDGDMQCRERCDDAFECPTGSCFIGHCTDPVGSSCNSEAPSPCGGVGLCLTINLQNQTVPGYCTRDCGYSIYPPCPNGYDCKNGKCYRQN